MSIEAATREFATARMQADLEQVLARLKGKPMDLLAYEEVRHKLQAENTERRALKDIPLDAIVGSVGRAGDFTRRFLPLKDSDARRWANVKVQVSELAGVPPIEVYQIGDVYFVLDGNHRVSVARQMGATHIEAYVTEVQSRVPVTPDVDAHDILVKSRYVDFLKRTGLDLLRPGVDLSASTADAYDILERHIDLHRYVKSVEQGHELAYQDALLDWYDHVYLMVVQVIRETNALRDFPNLTETDLYLVVSGYRALLNEALDWEFEAGDKAGETTDSHDAGGFISRVLGRVHETLVLDGVKDGVLPGEWRRQHVLTDAGPTFNQFHLFTNILTPLSGQETGWLALDQALEIARREQGRVLGLHIVPDAGQRDTPAVQAIRDEFHRRCLAAGVAGRLAVDVGPIASTVCERSGWVDLTVVQVTYPPPSQFLPRLGSGLRALIRHSRSPLLLLRETPLYPVEQMLIAYNGTARADNALRVAAYLARHWGVHLTVVSVSELTRHAPDLLDAARRILEAYAVIADYLALDGPVAETLLQAAQATKVGLIVVGGYGDPVVIEAVAGSAVDQLLRHSACPVLVC